MQYRMLSWEAANRKAHTARTVKAAKVKYDISKRGDNDDAMEAAYYEWLTLARAEIFKQIMQALENSRQTLNA